MNVAFLYNAQDHHVLHSLPIACELSRLPDMHVIVLARTAGQLALAQRLATLYPDNRLVFDLLRPPPFAATFSGASKLAKFASLVVNSGRLNSFDALVVPERTSLLLKRFGVTRPRYIHSFHGSSGHDRVLDPRLRQFDLLLAPSARRLQRIVEANALRPDHATVIGYSKLDLVRRLSASQAKLFANDRPVILYNPHHWADKSSWHVMGHAVLDHFSKRTDYNLIFAPHVRLFDPPEKHQAEFDRYAGFDHMLIDLGSDRSIDMTYTLAADIYLGDVSSQVFEFIVRARPCIFLNPRSLAWEADADFASWRLGPVAADLPALDQALATRDTWQPHYEPVQHEVAAESFPELDIPAPLRGARAIAAFLNEGHLRPGWDNATDADCTQLTPSNGK